jgi:hypothetical protein
MIIRRSSLHVVRAARWKIKERCWRQGVQRPSFLTPFALRLKTRTVSGRKFFRLLVLTTALPVSGDIEQLGLTGSQRPRPTLWSEDRSRGSATLAVARRTARICRADCNSIAPALEQTI